MGRTPCCEKVGLKKGKWTAKEDEILTKYIQANGIESWRSLPKKAGKQCRFLHHFYLRARMWVYDVIARTFLVGSKGC